MSLIQINRNPTIRELRIFGAGFLVFFALVGWGVYRRTGLLPAAGAVWALAILVPVIGLIVPEVLRLAYLGLTYATFPIGFVISHTVLAIVYYLVLTPIGLILRLCGRDPLQRRRNPQAQTYWVPHVPTTDVRRYFRQF